MIANGDVQAYREIFGKYFPKVYEAALAYTKVPEQAEDIVQGVFLKLWEKREQLGLIKSPKDWLFIVARNDIMSGFKKQVLQQNYQNHLKEVFREEEGTPEERLILRQKDEVMKAAETTDFPLRVICMMVGDDDPSNFSVAFRNQFGYWPGEVAKRRKRNKAHFVIADLPYRI